MDFGNLDCRAVVAIDELTILAAIRQSCTIVNRNALSARPSYAPKNNPLMTSSTDERSEKLAFGVITAIVYLGIRRDAHIDDVRSINGDKESYSLRKSLCRCTAIPKRS